MPFLTTPVRLARAAATLARFAGDQRRLLPRTHAGGDDAERARPAGRRRDAERSREQGRAAARSAFRWPRRCSSPAGADAAAAAKGLKAPFAVKIVSRDIAHKTEAGGVQARRGARMRWRMPCAPSRPTRRKAVPGAKIDGVLVSEMAQGIEALIGVINDESFGPVVALGLGGVLTEVLKDVTYRIAPFDIETAREMIADLRGAKLFDGYRGKPAGRQGGAGQGAGGGLADGGGAGAAPQGSRTSTRCSSGRTA